MVPPADDRLVVDDHRRRRRTTRVVLIDPHRRALLVEGRNPDDEQLTWMMVGSGIEDGENPAEAAARQVLKVTGRRGLPDGTGLFWCAAGR